MRYQIPASSLALFAKEQNRFSRQLCFPYLPGTTNKTKMSPPFYYNFAQWELEYRLDKRNMNLKLLLFNFLVLIMIDQLSSLVLTTRYILLPSNPSGACNGQQAQLLWKSRVICATMSKTTSGQNFSLEFVDNKMRCSETVSRKTDYCQQVFVGPPAKGMKLSQDGNRTTSEMSIG